MRFKTKKIERDFRNHEDLTPRQRQIREYADLIDRVSVLAGHGEITITDFLRSGDRHIHSLHHRNYGQAVDIRVRDESVQWYYAVVSLCRSLELLNPLFRVNPHFTDYRRDQQHIHIEVRN